MRRTTLLLLLATVLSGCEESTGPDQAVPADLDVLIPDLTRTEVAKTVAVTGDRPANTEDIEWSESIIFSSMIESGFRPDYAFAQATMDFWANRATIDLDMSLFYNNSLVAATSGNTSFAQWIPWRDQLHTSTALGIRDSCGHHVNAKAFYEAWHQIEPNGSKILGNSLTRPSVAHQPKCDPPPVKVTKEEVVGGNEEEDSDWYICYYTLYYDYYTGEYLGSEFHGCEPL